MFNKEVLYAEAPIVRVDLQDISFLKAASQENQRKRIRLCAHRDIDDTLHEMLIVHEQGTYVRPHKHPGKSESFHIIEGWADVVIFNDQGRIDEIIPMGDYRSERTFFYRLRPPLFHTLLIRSEILVFHETTNGPFTKADTIFAEWAPEERDQQRVAGFLRGLQSQVLALGANTRSA